MTLFWVKLFNNDSTPSVSFYLSLDSAILHYPAKNKKKRREYVVGNLLTCRRFYNMEGLLFGKFKR
jgi:hypothetical protein